MDILDILKKENIGYLECSKNFKKNIEHYKNEKDIKIIFVSNKNSFTGIYIPEITDIIFFENIDILDENKIISISNRIGRTNELNLHYF